MPSTTGIRGTTSLVARKYDVADVISLLDVDRYPLLAILTNAGKDPVTKQGKAMKKKETTDPEFKIPFGLFKFDYLLENLKAIVTNYVTKLWIQQQAISRQFLLS